MSGTMRGTPNRGQARGSIPFSGSPNNPNGSGIPRPVENTAASDLGVGATSTLSASRQKQSKRDEVCPPAEAPLPACVQSLTCV